MQATSELCIQADLGGIGREEVDHVVAQLVEALRYKPEGRFPMVSLEFFIDIILSVAL
jgi:hypothetical protein